jgi:hypothetical protein
MAVKAEAEDTSVVFRGLMVGRGLLCIEPPPPPEAAGAVGDAIKAEVTTERGRAERRLEMPACKNCHALFDPFGVMFEHYDTVGRYRTSIHTKAGDVPVNASWDVKLADIEGRVANGVDLSLRLAESRAARECVTRQIAAYAFGERLPPEQACTVAQVARRFDASGGDLRALVKDIATWPGLRTRRDGVAP